MFFGIVVIIRKINNDWQKVNYSPHSADFSKSPQPRNFSWARTATIWSQRWVDCGPAKLPTHFGDSQATGCCRSSDKLFVHLFWQRLFIWEQIMQKSDKSIKRLLIPMYISPWASYMYMYVYNLTGPWFSIYSVRKCEVERITGNPV